MDLVDIDKVLDNLELNEEKHKNASPASKQLIGSDIPSMNAPAPITDVTHDRNYFSTAVSNSTGDRVNRFVGVSHVFSSLNDYRKTIESLEVGMNLYRTETNQNDTSDDTKDHIQLAEEREDNPYSSDDINKFIAADEEHGLSSNSITTSSSSTFSSGPSPALLSTESESSFDARLMEKSVLHLKSNDDQSKRLETQSQYEPTNCNGQRQRSEYDDLAVGLSSISLENQGSTLSSEMASSKFMLRTDNLSSSLSLSQATKNFMNSDELRQHNRDPLEMNSQQLNESSLKLGNSESDRVDKASTAAQPTSQQNVMVTFGSTMDEISDTELDSILQEIDAEMPLQTCPETLNSDLERTDVLRKKAVVGRKFNSQNRDVPTPVFPTGRGCEDGMNIDSFSQASTIEYADDRTYEDDTDKNMDDIGDVDGSEEQKNFQLSIAQKRQRPTTLDLPVRKINLYTTAGQTPPGSRIYHQATSSSEEDTPERKAGLLPPANEEANNFIDAAGHTPPERSDRTIGAASLAEMEAANSVNNDDEPMPPNLNNIDVGNQAAALLPQNGVEMDPNLGKVPPIWVPDHEASACMHCQQKFTLLKRRHHCRSCGQVLCSICCSQKFKLEFLSNPESRVCVQCFLFLTKIQQQMEQEPSTATTDTPPCSLRTPNPNNPMEYCSTIPPHRQVNAQNLSSPTVVVPVGVLKKEGTQKKSRKRKSVMFSDGIRPGSDLASLDGKWSDAKHARKSVPTSTFTTENAGCTPHFGSSKIITRQSAKKLVMLDGNDSFIPRGEKSLPPINVANANKSEETYEDVPNNADLVKRLHTESLKFMVQTNFHVFVKISHLKCCINKTVIHFTTSGLHHVGNDEIIILLELDNSNEIPRDIFVHLNEIYWEASRGRPITELGFSMPKDLLFLGSREHGGFLFIRSTFQCLQDVAVPTSPFLIGVLIHRWEVPWAKIFPLRLMLRLGAQYRYYPSPHISVRGREPVYAEIAQTIINLLADFRNYTYTLPTVKGMYIHMEDRNTYILIPRNRHGEIIKAINNSSDHILAMGGNFSRKADGHLVCYQNTNTDSTDAYAYSTQAINIQGQPRKVTGASFIVLNEALKSTSGLSGKCSIIEDGLMVQILPTKMAEIRTALTNMRNVDIMCGPLVAGETQTEMVRIQWVDDDTEINIGVKSPIDSKEMNGIPSIRVHSGVTLSNMRHIIKWTEVFIVEITNDNAMAQAQCEPAVDISKISEHIAKSTSVALLPFLELLAGNGNTKIGLRVTLNQDNVCYEAGSQNEKLPPLYMNALDDELVPTLHKQAGEIQKIIVLELIFHILNV